MFRSSTIQRGPSSEALQVAIPAAVRQALDLRPGETLEWSVTAQGQMLLRRVAGAPASEAGKKTARPC